MNPVPSAGPIVTGFAAPWEHYLELGARREYRANEILLHPGEKTGHLYYVQKGAVLVSRFDDMGEIVRINIIREKAMLGIINMFTPTVSQTTWLTLRSCVCWLFPRSVVMSGIPRRLLLNLLEQTAFMSSTMSRRFVQGGPKRHEIRLARLLLHLVDADTPRGLAPRGIRISPNITQEKAGELSGMHPATVNKILAAFRAEGIIGKFTKTNLEIWDMNALCRYAEGAMPPLKRGPA
jgi:CRP-like cAMP-binding protein